MREETARHIAYLDGWRGLAILTVILGHFWLDRFSPGISILGVDLFFVLSGRLMAEILFVRRVPLKTFFIRRFSRIYPGLAFFVVATTIVFWNTPYRHGILAALAALTFTLNYAMIYTHPVAILDHLWSLCVEEHGYIVLALIAAVTRRRAWRGTEIIGTIGLIAVANGIFQFSILQKDYFEVFWRSDVQIASLFLAGALFLMRHRGDLVASQWISPLALVSAIVIRLCIPSANLNFALGSALLAISIATIDDTAPILKRALEFAPLRQLGLWSYSLYLWQQPFYKLHHDGEAPLPPMLAGAFTMALVSFYAVERPARNFINARWASRLKPIGSRQTA